jgi:hypothetical protein
MSQMLYFLCKYSGTVYSSQCYALPNKWRIKLSRYRRIVIDLVYSKLLKQGLLQPTPIRRGYEPVPQPSWPYNEAFHETPNKRKVNSNKHISSSFFVTKRNLGLVLDPLTIPAHLLCLRRLPLRRPTILPQKARPSAIDGRGEVQRARKRVGITPPEIPFRVETGR